MKLVTYVLDPNTPREEGRAGVLLNDLVLDLAVLGHWAAQREAAFARLSANQEAPLPGTLLALLRQGAAAWERLRAALELAAQEEPTQLQHQQGLAFRLEEVHLRPPIPDPPTIRDFFAFEAHVRNARARSGLEVPAQWYQIPVFYFSNTSALYGHEEAIPYPRLSQALDYELEIAAVIGRAGQDIPAEQASDYIAGYMIMNDWSARDLQLQEMAVQLGPAKGKDFATSFGPWLVTPDELQPYRRGSGADERFDLPMRARVNGVLLTEANFQEIYYTFPQMIERASQHVRLRPGDILGSGTCGGGCLLELGQERHRWLTVGDVVELEVEGLGRLRNTISGATA
ncbi:fumarylacetoacetate hydrolase family protein [Thermogemmatispora sp.]|uniref:fumarylacetoacetate hydrolase family protein n=1 Tax=Thermogemmatispora sp. TaxID=1968838 RepID=UPI001D2F949C|nr:fumarylacetoacetate hydrolase family protein [Thermogemmatispora sp.]MBX5452065.1 fumarylacetoacetate hydrolase family protein [Thermogemmatispora sp.]